MSECGRYRYWLGQSWGRAPAAYPTITFVMMNPSTADAERDDATMRACRRIAQHHGFLRLGVVNVMGFRATAPADLLRAEDPAGPLNALHARIHLSQTVGPIVCSWGQVHKRLARHEMAMVALLAQPEFSERLVALKIAMDGRPYHPLYQSPSTPLTRVCLVLGREEAAGGYRLVPNQKET